MIVDRTKAPVSYPIADFPLLRPQVYHLSNGIRVHYIESGTQLAVRFQAIFHAGKWYEQQKGSAQFMAKMLLEGTKKHSSAQIHELIDFYASFFVVYESDDNLFVISDCLSQHLPTIVSIFTEIITEASFPEKEWEIIRSSSLQDLKINLERNSFVASSLFEEHIFGSNHPYGYQLNEEMIASFSLDYVRSHYENFVFACPFEVIMAGKLEEKDKEVVMKQLESLFIKKDASPEGFKGSMSPSADKKIYQAKEKALQTSLRIGRAIFPANHPDQLPFMLLKEILGGYFGSRLMQNLREQKGYTYGIGARTTQLPHGSYFVISADVIKEHKDQAIEEIYKEIALLREQPVGEEELEKVKTHLAGTHINSLSQPFMMAEYYKLLLINKLPDDFYDHYISNIRLVSAERILEMANKYLQESSFIEIAVG